MKFLLLSAILFAQIFFSCGRSSKTKSIDFKYGTIIERTEDVFITASNIVIEVNMRAIFLPENDVISLKNDISRFITSLKEMHKRHFPFDKEHSLAQTLSMAEMLSQDLIDKTYETIFSS